jgi:hypothetical protein
MWNITHETYSKQYCVNFREHPSFSKLNTAHYMWCEMILIQKSANATTQLSTRSIIDVWRQQHGAWKKACRTSYIGFLSFPITNEWTFMKSPLNLRLVQLHDQVTCQMCKMLCSSCSKEMLQKTIRHIQSCCYLIRLKTDIARDTVKHVFSTSSCRSVKEWLFRTVIDALLNMYQY